jgi:hypothetical protein
MPSQMDQPNHLLSVVTDPEGDVVFIHGDRAGLECLRSAIDRLLRNLAEGKTDHDHFRSTDWAGSELTTSMLSSEKEAGCRSVHHVKIYSWSDEWKKKQGL